MLVHPLTDMPVPEEGGLSLPAGFETVINMDVEEHHYLGDPYGSCNPQLVNPYGYHYSSVVRRTRAVTEGESG